jgi:nucleoside-diphosphate-sugar epimerase
LLGEVTGKKIEAKYEPPRPGDIRDSQADITLAHKILGYKPLVHFEEGIRRTWDWYTANFGGS